MRPIITTKLKVAADFVTSGRAFGIADDALFAIIAGAARLDNDEWKAFVAWFNIGK